MRQVLKLNKDYMYFYTKVSSANVTPSGRMVYRALLRYANRKTWSCFPSVKTIVNDTGLVMYSHGEYFGFGDKLGSFGYSVRKTKK